MKINNLASHVLGKAAKQLPNDWRKKHNYQPVLLETFVDAEKYAGTCYKVANRLHVGKSKGRSRYDRYKEYLSYQSFGTLIHLGEECLCSSYRFAITNILASV